MWVLYAFGSALFAGITAVLAKIGIKGVNSHLATALRTVVEIVTGGEMKPLEFHEVRGMAPGKVIFVHRIFLCFIGDLRRIQKTHHIGLNQFLHIIIPSF